MGEVAVESDVEALSVLRHDGFSFWWIVWGKAFQPFDTSIVPQIYLCVQYGNSTPFYLNSFPMLLNMWYTINIW